MHGIDPQLRPHFYMLLMFSGYDGYFTMEEIAKFCKIKLNTLRSRLYRIGKKHPELMKKLREDRNTIKRATLRSHGLKSAKSFKPSMTPYIREKF